MSWKLPPTDETKKHINKSMELQLLLLCNWTCHACDQFSNLPSISWVRKATMSIDQIQSFIDEMHKNNAYLGRIRLLGGEPTMHPKFGEIVRLIHSQLVPDHLCSIEVITNGSKMDKFESVRDLVKIRVSGQRSKEKHHTANLVQTPKSLGYRGKICNAPWHCGFSLNYYGYFPCSSGAGIARLRNLMQYQRMELPLDVNETWPDLQDLCDHCYHGLKPEHKIKCGTDQYEKNVPNQDNWEQLAPWLHGKQPDWRVYACN